MQGKKSVLLEINKGPVVINVINVYVRQESLQKNPKPTTHNKKAQQKL